MTDWGARPALRLSPWGRRAVWIVLYGASILGLLIGLGALRLHLELDPLTDFHDYYDAAARLNAGLPLYPPGVRIYPPLFHILMRPLALLPFDVAASIWVGIVAVSYGLTLWRIGIWRKSVWLAVGLVGVGIGWTIAIGQVESIIMLLLTLGSPLTVAMAANIKLFPILAGTYWVARRDWRSVGRLVGWTVGLVLLQLVLDPTNTLAFPASLNVVDSQVASPANLSPFAISPVLWAALLLVGVTVTIRLGRTRWGWPAAVTLAVLASPHLLSYMLTSLLACLRPSDEWRSSRPPIDRSGTRSRGSSSMSSPPRSRDAGDAPALDARRQAGPGTGHVAPGVAHAVRGWRSRAPQAHTMAVAIIWLAR